MNANATSDSDTTTMAATLAFEAILSQVQTSNLNFRIELSPFSAVINIKKSLIRNKHGILATPPPPNLVVLQRVNSENLVLSHIIVQLENIIESIKGDYENAVTDCEKSYKMIAKLENELEMARANVAEIKEELDVKVKLKLQMMTYN